AVLIGPRTYGLPYRLGRLNYHNEPWREQKHGEIKSGSAKFAYRATLGGRGSRRADCAIATGIPARQEPRPPDLDEFLLDRYTAFTHRAGVTRRFDVAHAPWPQ